MSQCHISLDLYAKHLKDGFAELQHSEEFVDMTIAADDHVVKVHKNLMALASPYIREMIKSVPCPHPVIFLSNIRKQILTYILEYIYTGEVNVRMEHVNELIKAAKLLHLKGLEFMVPPQNMSSKASGQRDESDNTEVDEEKVNIDEDVLDTQNKIEINTDNDNDNQEEDVLEGNEYYHYQTTDVDVEMETQDPVEPSTSCVEKPSLLQKNTVISQKPVIESVVNPSGIPAYTITYDPQNASGSSNEVDSTKSFCPPKGLILYYTGSTKGTLQLIANRYMYYLHHTAKGGRKIRWRCIDYRLKGCKALIDTYEDVITARKNNHLHPMHDEKILKVGNEYGTYTSPKEAKVQLAIRRRESRNRLKKYPQQKHLDTD